MDAFCFFFLMVFVLILMFSCRLLAITIQKLIYCNGPFTLQHVYKIDIWYPAQWRLLWYMLKRLR